MQSAHVRDFRRQRQLHPTFLFVEELLSAGAAERTNLGLHPPWGISHRITS
jgi:hypothetical protein